MPDDYMDEAIIWSIVTQLLRALDYLHAECIIVHTGMIQPAASLIELSDHSPGDINPNNIIQEVHDDSILRGQMRLISTIVCLKMPYARPLYTIL
jgi:serine/threonine protein kinase